MRFATLACSTAAALALGFGLGWVLRGAVEVRASDPVQVSTPPALEPSSEPGPEPALEASTPPPVVTARVPVESTAEPQPAAGPGALLYTVKGTVRDTRGRPFVGAEILADCGDRSWREKSRARGEFVLDRAPAGTCQVWARAAGYASDRVEVVLDGPAREREVTLELRPKRALEVRVVTSGGGDLQTELGERGHRFARLHVVAYRERDLEERLSLEGGDRWSPHPEGGRSTRIWVEEQGGFVLGVVWKLGTVATTDVVPGQERVDLMVSAEEILAGLCAVTFRVVRADTGAPVPVSVFVNLSSDGMGMSFQSDEAGSVDRGGLRPGAWQLLLRAPGFAQLESDFDLVEGQQLDLGDIAMNPVPAIRGVVLDEDGAPVPAARVTFIDVRAEAEPLETTTKPDGTFELHGVGGAGAVCAWRQEQVGNRIDRMWASPPAGPEGEDLRLKLAPATEVLLTSQDRRAGHLHVTDREGGPVHRRDFRGSISLWLLPGEYVATRTYADGSPGASTGFTVGESWQELKLQ